MCNTDSSIDYWKQTISELETEASADRPYARDTAQSLLNDLYGVFETAYCEYLEASLYGGSEEYNADKRQEELFSLFTALRLIAE